MKKISKNGIGKIILTVVLGAIAFIAIKRGTKKELANLEKQEKAARKELTDLGLSDQVAESMIKQSTEQSENEGIVKELFALAKCSSNPRFSMDDDILNINSALKSQNVIYVKESDFRGREQLDIILQIPDYKKGSYTTPRISDYKRTFSEMADTLQCAMMTQVSGRRLTHTRITCYALVDYENINYNPENKDDCVAIEPTVPEYVEIDESVFESFAEEFEDGHRNNGAVKFYEAWYNGELTDEQEAILNEFVESSREERGELEDIMLVYKISIPIAKTDSRGHWIPGITLEMAGEFIKRMAETMVVERDTYLRKGKQDASGKRYDHVLYCGRDRNGRKSMTWLYFMEKRKIVCSPWFFGDNE